MCVTVKYKYNSVVCKYNLNIYPAVRYCRGVISPVIIGIIYPFIGVFICAVLISYRIGQTQLIFININFYRAF